MEVGSSVRKEKLCSYSTEKHEISYLRIFRKSVQKIQVPLKSDKNNGYFTRRQKYIFDHISFNSSYNETCFRHSCEENRKERLMFNNFYFFFENRAAYEIRWKNVVEREDRRLQYGASTLHVGYLRL